MSEHATQRQAVYDVLAALSVGGKIVVCGLAVERMSPLQWQVWPLGECSCGPSSWPVMGLATARDRIVEARPGAPVRRAR